MKKLNLKKPYAEFIGDNGGIKYEQDGIPFDHQGNEVVAEKEPAQKTKKESDKLADAIRGG